MSEGALGFHASHRPFIAVNQHKRVARGAIEAHWRVECSKCGAAQWNNPDDISPTCGLSVDYDARIKSVCKVHAARKAGASDNVETESYERDKYRSWEKGSPDWAGSLRKARAALSQGDVSGEGEGA